MFHSSDVRYVQEVALSYRCDNICCDITTINTNTALLYLLYFLDIKIQIF